MTERSRQGGERQQVEIALGSLKREFRLGETLASTLGAGHQDRGKGDGLHLRGFYINRVLGRPQGHIKELWA